MEKQQKIVILILGTLLLLLIVALCVGIALQNRPVYGEFVPPAWESNAVSGMPSEPLPPNFGSMTVDQGFVLAMSATPRLRGNDLDLYFTSPDSNTVWLRVRIYDANGQMLYESGLLKPGEHLPTVTLSAVPTGNTVVADILSYEPETYYSRGTAKAELLLTSAN